MERIAVATPRRDKKKEIKANLPRGLRDTLEKYARDCGMSPMSYAAGLTMAAINDERIIRSLAPWFKRGYVPRYAPYSVMMGHVIGPDLEPLLPEGDGVTRFPVKLPQEDHLAVGEVAYSLSCSLSQALTILLSEALRQGVVVNG